MLSSLTLLCLLNVMCFSKSHSGSLRCSPSCVCIWRNGKILAECIKSELTNVPTDLGNTTQILDLKDNNITHLKDRNFYDSGLVNLQKIFLSHCNLSIIEDKAFYQLNNLIELDLGYNNLKHIPSVAFKDSPRLRRLELNNNPIEEVKDYVFVDNSELTLLDLSSCKITFVSPYAFKGLKNLQYFKLNDNFLSTLSENVIMDLHSIFLFDLYNNPWICDCHLYGIRKWMLEKQVPTTVVPICVEPPRVKKKMWSTIELSDFACVPEIQSGKGVSIWEEGQNVTLYCSVQSIPEAEVTWIWNGRVIGNITIGRRLKTPIIMREEGNQDKLGSLRIINVTVANAGDYICKVSNKAGFATSTVFLRITPAMERKVKSLSNSELVGILIGIMLFLAMILVIFYLYYNRGQTYDISKANHVIFEINTTTSFPKNFNGSNYVKLYKTLNTDPDMMFVKNPQPLFRDPQRKFSMASEAHPKQRHLIENPLQKVDSSKKEMNHLRNSFSLENIPSHYEANVSKRIRKENSPSPTPDVILSSRQSNNKEEI